MLTAVPMIVWGRVNDAEHAAPAWLLHRTSTGSEVALSDMRGDLARLESASNGTIRVRDLPFSTNASFEPVEMTSRAPSQRRRSGLAASGTCSSRFVVMTCTLLSPAHATKREFGTNAMHESSPWPSAA